MRKAKSVADIVGPWVGDTPTGLVRRCKEAWDTPLPELSDLMVATFLSQKIAISEMLAEAEKRLKDTPRDDTELFDGQLKEAAVRAKGI